MASGIPSFEMVFNLNSMGSPSPSAEFLFGASDLPDQHEHRIIKFIHDALLQRNDRIVCNVDLLGAHFRTALGDVAQTDAKLILQHLGATSSREDAFRAPPPARKTVVPRTAPSFHAHGERGTHSG